MDRTGVLSVKQFANQSAIHAQIYTSTHNMWLTCKSNADTLAAVLFSCNKFTLWTV